MNRYQNSIQRGLLAVLVAALGASFAVPAFAMDTDASPGDEIDARLEECYNNAQEWYDIQDSNLALAADILDRAADIVEQLKEHDFDTSQIEALLAEANGLLPHAQADHDTAASILNTHAGFEGGQVVDRWAAWETCRTAANSLDGARRTLLEIRSIGLEIRQILISWRTDISSE